MRILATLIKLASSEEESVLADATVIDYGQMRADLTPDINEFIGNGFFSLIHTTYASPQVEYTVDLGKSLYIQSIFILNRCGATT